MTGVKVNDVVKIKQLLAQFVKILLFLNTLQCSATSLLPARKLKQKSELGVTNLNVHRLAAIVAEAESGTVFNVANDIRLSSTIIVTEDRLTFRSSDRAQSVIRCAVGSSGFIVKSSDVVFENLVFRDCSHTAIYVFEERSSSNGDAAAEYDDEYEPFDPKTSAERPSDAPRNLTISLRNLRFLNNSVRLASRSTGILMIGDHVRATITSCIFDRNEGKQGAAISFSGDILKIENSIFTENIADLAGGAISGIHSSREVSSDSTIQFEVTNCSFADNGVTNKGRDDTVRKRKSDLDLKDNVSLGLPLVPLSGGAIYVAGYTRVKIGSCNFTNNSVVLAGGAIHVGENRDIVITSCRFFNNFVVPQPKRADVEDLQRGGALLVASATLETSLILKSSVFINNSATHGGAFYYNGPVTGQVQVTRCIFARNRAKLGGGAVVLRNATDQHIIASEFTTNSAFAGGALLVDDGATIMFPESIPPISQTLFERNTAVDGGAIYIVGGGKCDFFRTLLHQNRAERNGGAVCTIDGRAGRLLFQDIKMVNNTGKRGGAIFADSVPELSIGVSFGQLYDPGQGNVPLSKFEGNTAVSGGAIYVIGSNSAENILRISGVLFTRNRAYPDTSLVQKAELNSDAVYAFGRTFRTFNDSDHTAGTRLIDLNGPTACDFGGGGAICLSLSSVPSRSVVRVDISTTTFANNSAQLGGALLVSTADGLDWGESCALDNLSWAIFLASDGMCRRIRLRDVEFEGNVAAAAGGAILASDLSHLYYSSAIEVASNLHYQSLDTVSDRKNYIRNGVASNGYGKNIAGAASRLELIGLKVASQDGVLFNQQSGGPLNPLPQITIAILDALNQTVSDGIKASAFRIQADARIPSDNSSIVSGQATATAKNGIAVFNELSLVAPPEEYEVTFFVPGEDVQPVRIKVKLRECAFGEIFLEHLSQCELCDRDTFTFFSTAKNCSVCPKNAVCVGTASVRPVPHHWQSSRFSLIMHKCLSQKSCGNTNPEASPKKNRARDNDLSLQHFLKEFEQVNGTQTEIYQNTQCSKGYNGPVCGSCDCDYGRVDHTECVECASRRSTALRMSFLMFWQLLALVFTLRSAMTSAVDVDELAASLQHQETISTAGSRSRLGIGLSSIINSEDGANHTRSTGIRGMPVESLPQGGSIEINANDSSRGHRQTKNSNQLRAECITSIQHVSEAIKIFVNFGQVTALARGIELRWSTILRRLLTALGDFARFSFGSSFLPTSCLLDSCSPESDNRAVYAMLIRTAIHITLMLVLMAYFIIITVRNRNRNVSRRSLKSSLIVCFLVVSFYAYQSVSEDILPTFSCIKLDSAYLVEIKDQYDDPAVGVDYSQFSVALGNYWTEDTSLECYADTHLLLVVFFGIFGFVVFVAGLPLYLLIFLLYKRMINGLSDLEVLNTYGFIYQNYRESLVFWEVIILLRKALIGSVAIYSYPLGANLQGVVVLGLLVTALALHLISSPFKYLALNVLEGFSLMMSILTFYAGVLFSDDNVSQTTQNTICIVLLVLTFSFALAVFCTILVHGDRYLEASLKLMNVKNIPTTSIGRLRVFLVVHGRKLRQTAGFQLENVWKRLGSLQTSRTVNSDCSGS